MKTTTLKESYSHCEEVIKEHSKSFYAAFSRLPKEKANVVYALYAFCRHADDSVDNVEAQSSKRENIVELQTELEEFFSGKRMDKPFWICLQDVFSRYNMNHDAFRLQLKGQSLDVVFEQPQNLEQLIDYSYHVASSVGFMMLPIIATKNYAMLGKPAENLGIAMQLTNILRDIGEDYHDLGRIYLPKELMKKYNVTEKLIAQEKLTIGFENLWEELAQLAERKYETFYESVKLFDEDSQKQLILSAKIYSEILNVIRQDNYTFLEKRNYVSRPKMLKIIANINEVMR